ncbi:Peptidase M16, C-terminal [Dillenia turbinata]|uniref:Peptidase M16, C-terminal n=1 Tax=Dillenia turbinata TaxID=194707 RepID=A0AAN8W2K9_9MAGN
MYRSAASRLRALKSRGGNKALLRFASSSSVATRTASSGGIFGWFKDEPSTPPLDFPLHGVSLPPSLPDKIEPGKTKITTLPNGLRIASETSPSAVASVGLYLDCGSVYETLETSGATNLLERMAFKSTINRSHLRLVRELEAIGSNATVGVSREQIGYSVDGLKTYLPEMVELGKLKAELAEVSNNPQSLLVEVIHSAGFCGSLANPLIASESAISGLNSDILEKFVTENYTAARMVLASSGVEHEELVKIAEPLLSDLHSTPRPEEPKSVYVGGDYRFQGDAEKTHIALAFELPGGWHKEKDAVTLAVLQMLMGGGGSFSAGGPGKGMYSRLYLNVLNQFPEIQSFSAFNSTYNNTSIFGVQATTALGYASKAIDIAAKELSAIATPGQVDEVQLKRAKESTKSAILMNLESRVVVSEDIGRQVLTHGERKPVEHLLKTIDGVTLKDITDIAKKLFSSPLTMASYGNVIDVPSYDSVSRKFKTK